METMDLCPACRGSNALLALGTRLDRPYRWRPWITRSTELYLCDNCDAIVAMAVVDHGMRTLTFAGEVARTLRPALPGGTRVPLAVMRPIDVFQVRRAETAPG